MLDFNARRYCLLLGDAADTSAPVTRAPTFATSPETRLRRLVHLSELAERTSLSKKQIWHLVRIGKLDAPIRLNYRAFAWSSHYVSDWLKQRGHLLS